MKFLKEAWFLKIFALATAILTYIFIHNEMFNISATPRDSSYKLIKLTAKKLPLKVRLASAPPDGYHILDDQVVSNPKQVIVVGPEALLNEASAAETALIDVSESTKTVTKKIPLESIAGIPLAGEPFTVEVTVPIEKTKE